MTHANIFLLIAVLFYFLSVFAGIGGSSGGTQSAEKSKYITAKVCEFDGRCTVVTYLDRGPSPYEEPKEICYNYDGDSGSPCPKKHKVPGWLRRLNTAFGNPSVVESAFDESFDDLHSN